MPQENDDRPNPLVTLEKALTLVEKAIVMAEQALEMNPTKEEERDLNETLNKLQRKRAEISAELDALTVGNRQVIGPSKEQVAEISSLTGEVEKLTNQAIAASAAVKLTSRVLALATEVASASQNPGKPKG